MAYMSQERKKKIVAAAKPILAKYGVKATFSVSNHSTIVCTLKEGKVDFKSDYLADWDRDHHDNYMQINPYHFSNAFQGTSKQFLSELVPVLNKENWNNSRIEIDYFDVGWYVNVNIGSYKKGYVLK